MQATELGRGLETSTLTSGHTRKDNDLGWWDSDCWQIRNTERQTGGLGIQVDRKQGTKRAMANFKKNTCPTQDVTSYKLPVI